MENLAESFDGEVGEGGSVLLGQGLNKFECFLNSNGQLDSDNTFRRGSPGAQHDFLSDGDVFGSGQDFTNGNVGTNH